MMQNPMLPDRRPDGELLPAVNGYGSRLESGAFVAGFRVREALAILRRRVWVILLISAATIAPVVYLALREQPTYQAGAMIRLVDARRALAGGVADAGGEQQLGAKSDAILSQLEVLYGRTVLGEVVDRVGLRVASETEEFPVGLLRDISVNEAATVDSLELRFSGQGLRVRSRSGELAGLYGVPIEIDGVRFTVAEAPAIEVAVLRVIPREWAIDIVAANLRTEPRHMTDAVAIYYTAGDPHTAQRAVNGIIEVFQGFNARAAQQQSRRRRLFLEEQLRGTDSLLAEAQLALSSFRSRERVFSSREKLSAQQQGLMDLEIRWEELDADRRMYQSLLANLQGQPAAARTRALRALVSSPGIASNSIVAHLYQQLAQHEADRESLTTGALGITAAHPDVERIDGLIASTQNSLIDALRSHVFSLEARIAALGELRARSSHEVAQLPRTEVEEVRLVQQSETMQKVADQLREELQRARMAEAVETGQVEIVYPAPLPAGPNPRGRARKLALGMVLGLMLGCGGAFALEAANPSIRRREDLEITLRMPGLVTVPRLPGLLSKEEPGARSWHRLIYGGTNLAVQANGSINAPAEGAFGVEAYRMLRNNLLFARPTASLKSIAVVSAAPGEGKTTTATNLSVTFARQESRVLLLDCDLLRPQAHRAFSVPRSPGLAELASGECELADTIRATSVPHLFVLPAGERVPGRPDAVTPDYVAALLQRLSRGFSMIILDTPPLLVAADGLGISRLADGVVLVVRAGQTERGMVRQAMQQLEVAGAHVLGAVLNDPDNVTPAYGGYQYHYYSQA